MGRALPDKVVTNKDLEKIVDTNDEWIRTRTGICERRIADEKTATSDLAVEAAQKAIKNSGITPEQIDMIIIATVTPDMAFPSTACLVQKELNGMNAACFDIEAACTGFLYGLSIGSQFIENGTYKYVLVIGAETLSKITDWEDRNTCVLFGDGAGACILGPSKDDSKILAFDLGSDGTRGELLTQPAGGSRLPASNETVNNKKHFIHMSGNEVFKFAVRVMGDTALRALDKAGKEPEEIDYLVPHQANLRIINSAVKRLNLKQEKVFINLSKYGNMSAASIPVALDEAQEQGEISKGDLVVLVGFGGGLTWGSTVMIW